MDYELHIFVLFYAKLVTANSIFKEINNWNNMKIVVVLHRNTASSYKWRGRNRRITYVPHYSDNKPPIIHKGHRKWSLVAGVGDCVTTGINSH